MDRLLRSVMAALPDDPTSASRILRTVPTEQWPSLFEQSIRHGVSGVLEPCLDAERVPPETWAAFLLHNTDHLLSFRSLTRSLEEIVSWMDAADVRVCGLKGPALATRLYDDPSVRVSTDLDLLVLPEDFERAVDVLRAYGYIGGSDATTSYLLKHSHHLDFSKDDAASIELHFQTYVGFGVTVPASALMDRAIEYQVTPRCKVLVPSAEDELMYLAVHAAGHSFVRLAWLYDMKMLLRKHPHLNWDAVVARSEQAGISTAVGFAVGLLTRWLQMPRAAAAAFRRRGVRLAAANAMLRIAATETDRSALSNLKGLVFTALLCNRASSAGWLLQHHILRSVRRRAHRMSPQWVPTSWSG
jgi:hypothetical protein